MSANHLSGETSSYLLQHADNPVAWYPWGEEALNKARTEDKPIFLSIGYSACHWCHVMAHESFEDEGVAAILNEHFVSIKVDREERPDLDRIYMAAVQAMTGSGGWPMSVFLLPDGRPFYGGTYFPPEPRHGMPAFSQVLLAIAEAWRTRRAELENSGHQIAEVVAQNAAGGSGRSGSLSDLALQRAVEAISSGFDERHAGWGAGPKFPQPVLIEFLLRYAHRTGDERALQMATRTLEAMARGGLYDQLGGGFHRYAVDAIWLVPHFEKMLYDNAQLARAYLHAWQMTGAPLFRAIVEETLDYVLREMTDPSGGFCATQDADSEGQEGRFFLWDAQEIVEILGSEAAEFMSAYGVTSEGNFEGRNILSLQGSLEQRQALAPARARLWAARQERVAPGRDDKVVTAWNGLMLAAFAEAGQALGRQDYVGAAERNAKFLLSELRTGAGRLLHTWKDGQARLTGYLDDYTHVIDGLLALYEATFEARWYVAAQELADAAIAHYAADVGFYDTSDDHEALIVRPRERQDNAVPSGNAMAAWVLQRLAHLAQDVDYARRAQAMLEEMVEPASRYPTAFAQWLIALDYALAATQQVAVIGEAGDPATEALLSASVAGFHPHRLVAWGAHGDGRVPLVREHALVDGQAAAYVCNAFACQEPVTQPEALRAQLR